MKPRLYLLAGLLFASTFHVFGQTQAKKEYYIGECSKNQISIDGKLDEQAWREARWQDDFTQYEPSEGKKPSQKTEFAVLLDEYNIYVGFKCWDSSPDSIVQRLTRRDEQDGDFVAAQFDSYFDKRTAFSFMVNAAGIKYDFIISNDGDEDNNLSSINN